MTIEICELKKTDEKTWDDYIYRSANSTFFHQIGWKRVVEKTYGHKPVYLIAEDDGEIKGVLPLFLMKSRIFGKKLVSVPFAPYGGVCADNGAIERELIREAKRITDELNLDYLELRHFDNLGNGTFVSDKKYVTFILALDQDPEVVWRKFNNKVRNAIRKGLKSELKVEEAVLKDFYEIYTRGMRSLGTPPHSYEFFKNLISQFSEQTKIVSVLYRDVVVAAMFLLSFKENLISGWAASDRRYWKFNPNNVLYWEVIKNACEEGYRYFDFGRSMYNSGTFKFKKPWGTEIRTLTYQYYCRNVNGRIPDTSQISPKRQKFAKIWRKLPLPLTNRLGPKLRRNFP